jgi:flagellar export protein FliJ
VAARKFHFRLATVARVRRIEEERARAALLAANLELHHAATRLAERKDHYWSAPRPVGTTDAEHFRPAWMELDFAAKSVQWSTTERIEKAEVADLARTDYITRRQRVEALDRLEQRSRELWHRDVLRAEDHLVDDLVVSRIRTTKGSTS